MKAQLFFDNLLFTTQLFSMEQIYTFCSFTLFTFDSLMFNIINNSLMKKI